MKKEIEGRVYYVAANGALVPEEIVKEQDKLRDDLVNASAEKILELRMTMIETKAEIIEERNHFLDLISTKYGAKSSFATSGNLTISNYDGSLRLQFNRNEKMSFNEGINIAKIMIDEYLDDLTKNSNSDIKTIVSSAFKIKQGSLDVKSVLKLRSLSINDPRWRKAMDVISDSLITTFTNTSMRLYRRNPNGEMVLLPVDLSVLEC